MHISSSYAKILGETNFQPREFPWSGSKSEYGEKRERKDWTMVITMDSYALQMPPRVAHAKPPGPKSVWYSSANSQRIWHWQQEQDQLEHFSCWKPRVEIIEILVQACLRAPHVVVDEAKLAIVFTYFFLLLLLSSFFFFFFSAFYFSPTSGNLPCVKICFPQYFGITRRYMQKKIFFLGNFYFFYEKKLIFACTFGTASVRSRSLDQPLVPGVLD